MARECITCAQNIQHEKGAAVSSVTDCGGGVYSFSYQRPLSKGATYITTKKHRDDLRNLTAQEWYDMLPVIKESINKIEKVYKPIGYRLNMPTGKLANQNQPPHFFARLIPKYKKGFGMISVPLSLKQRPPHSEFEVKKKMFREALLPLNQNKNGLVVNLHDKDELMITTKQQVPPICLSISTKRHLPNDINSMDQETWNKIGELLKELMAKIEANTDCHDFSVDLLIGEKAAKIAREEAEVSSDDILYSDSELVVNLFPLYGGERWYKMKSRPVRDGKLIGRMENERIAEKLRDPEGYAKIWGKKSTPSLRGHEEETIPSTKSSPSETSPRESLWKQSSTYLIFASGIGITCLGLAIYYLIKNKKTPK